MGWGTAGGVWFLVFWGFILVLGGGGIRFGGGLGAGCVLCGLDSLLIFHSFL